MEEGVAPKPSDREGLGRQKPPRGRLRVNWLQVLAIVTSGMAIGFVVVALWVIRETRRRQAVLDAEWKSVLLPLSEIHKRFAATGADSAGVELDRLEGRLGVGRRPTFITKEEQRAYELAHPDIAAQKVFEHVVPELWSFIDRASRTASDEAEQAPDIVGHFLREHHEQLQGSIALLRRPELPHGEVDLLRFEEDLARADAHSSLNLLLLAVALERNRAGDSAGAWEALEAASALLEALTRRSEEYAQHEAVRSAKSLAAVMRKMKSGPPTAARTFFATDYRTAFLVSVEAKVAMDVYPLGPPRTNASVLRTVVFHNTALGRAAIRNAELMSGIVRELRRVSPCEYTAAAERRLWEQSYQREGPLVQVFSPFLLATHWENMMFRLLVERELTDRVLSLKATPATQGQDLCADQVSSLRSGVCPGVQWNCRRGAGGRTMTVAFPRPLETQGFEKSDLPLSHTWTLEPAR
jgi:hypothetical protein